MNNPLIIQIKDTDTVKGKTFSFVNGSGLPEEEAVKIFENVKRLIERGESFAGKRLGKEADLLSLYRESLWTEKDLEDFEKFNLYPYEFKDHRTVINTLISRQRENKFKFKVIPNDVNSFRRFKDGMEAFLEQHAHEFPSKAEALEYYNNVADDKYAVALSAYLSNIRHYNEGEYEESDMFENGVVIGGHAIKAVYGNQVFTDGGIQIESVPLRALIYDEDSIKYNRSDIEFIGETYDMNLVELMEYFPDLREPLYALYESKTNTSYATNFSQASKSYSDRFKFTNSSQNGNKIKVHDMYVLTLIERFVVTDNTDGSTREVEDHLITEEEVWDKLKAGMLLEMSKTDPELNFATEELPGQVENAVRQRFTVEKVPKRTWFQAIVTEKALLYWGPSKYPHRSHPYSIYYPQFTQGKYNSVLEEIMDCVRGLNKATMFQELMMGTSAKGVLVVNQDVLAASGLSVDDIAESYTEIGGVIALKLKNPMQKLDSAIMQLTTVGQGIAEMDRVIQRYEMRLRSIAGVTLAQMGVTPGETPTGRYKLELAQGQQNNGVIFDNFIRTLKSFYQKKVLPLCVYDMKNKKTSVLRVVGDQHSKWINVDLDDDFDMFAGAIREGQVGLMLVPDDNDPQMKNARAAQLMQFATATGDPTMFAWALKFSDDPNKNEIVRELYKTIHQAQVAQVQNQVDLQMVQQMALEQGIPMEVAAQLVSKLQVEKMKQIQAQQSGGRARQGGMGANATQLAATESTRMNTLEQGR